MKLRNRVVVAASFIAAALVGNLLLMAHLGSTPPLAPSTLQVALDSFPRQVGDWKAEDLPMDQRLLFADQHVYRVYRNEALGRSVVLWLAFSHRGVDREHHPEICMEVHGKREDRSQRGLLAIDDGAPVQKFKFVGGGTDQLVFYWHYTLPFQMAGSMSDLQELYHRLRNRPASLTIQVFSPATAATDNAPVEAFVRDVDAMIQQYVGANAVRGSDLMPVLNEAAL